MNSGKDRRSLKQMRKKLKLLPTNLRKQAIREARNAAGMQRSQRRLKNVTKKKNTSVQNEFERAEHNAMLAATSQELQQILADCEELADISHDCTPAELWGKIATAERRATTIYVKRDGLSTLQIVLHQRSPTIAQLKKAIASISLAQYKRRQRDERRALAEDNAGQPEAEQSLVASASASGATLNEAKHRCYRSSCELVNSAQRNGHEHRAHVSWRFLWRCFALYNVDTNQAIDENSANGRATLTSLGIKNGCTLKFIHRVKYFGRRRQT